MTKKLFVGGLSWGTGDEQLKAAFETFGTVSDAKVVMDRDTGRSRGFGFVSFTEDGAAQRALSEMDGKDLDGRSIRVNEAQEKPRPPRDSGGSGGGGGGGYRQSSGGGRGGGGGAREGGGGGRKPRYDEGRKTPGDKFDRRRNSQTKRGRPSNDYGHSDSHGDSDDFE